MSTLNDNGNRLAFIRQRLPVALVHYWLVKYLIVKVPRGWIRCLERCIASGVNYSPESAAISSTVTWFIRELTVMAFCEKHGQVYGEGSACPVCAQESPEEAQQEIEESSEE